MPPEWHAEIFCLRKSFAQQNPRSPHPQGLNRFGTHSQCLCLPGKSMRYNYLSSKAFQNVKNSSRNPVDVARALENTVPEVDVRSRSLLKQLPAVVYIAEGGAHGRWSYVSPRIESLLGFSPDEWMANPAAWSTQLHPDDKERVLAQDHLSSKDGRGFVSEYRLLTKSGKVVWVRDEATVLGTESGKPPLMQGILLDITVSKAAQSELSKVEQRLSEVISNAPIVIFAIDSNGVFTLSEGMGLRALGLAPGEVVGRSVFEMYRDYPSILDNVRRVLSGEEVASVAELPDLQLAYETKWTPQKDAAGRVIGATGVATDISRRRQAESVLNTTRERLRLALEASGMCLWDLDATTGDVYLSEGWSVMLGREPRETHTHVRQLFAITHPEDRGRILTEALNVLKTDVERYREEHRVRNANGDWIWVESMGRVVARDENGRALRAIGTNLDITKRKNAEDALRQSEEKYASMIKASPDAITLRTLPDCRYIDVNESFTQMTGYSREEVLGKSIEELNILIDAQKHARLVNKVRQAGDTQDDEFRYRTRAGEVRIGKVSATRVNVGGNECVLSVTRDVTNSKLAEEALRASEERFRTLVESLQATVLILGPRGEIQFANRAALQLFGHTFEEIVGKTSIELGWNPVDQNGDELPLEMRPAPRVLATGKPVRNEVFGWRRPGSGEFLWTIGDLVPLLGKDGKLEKIVVAFSDITLQIRAAEALRQSEEKYAKMIQFSPDAVSLRGFPDLRYLDVNKQWVQMFGYSRDEALGRTAGELNIAQDEDRLDIVEPLKRGDEVRGKEVRYRTKAGASRIAWASAIQVEVGGRICVLSITRDITEQRRGEEALRKSELRMQTIQKMEAVGRLAGGIAHDFNNMLMVVSGQLELLREQLGQQPEHIRKIEQAQKAAERAASLTRQLLAFSRMQALQPQVVNLSNIVSEMNKLIAPMIGPNIQIETKLASSLDAVKADPAQIEQVILNLVVNARDAMPQGGRLSLETMNVELDAQRAQLHPPMTAGRYVLLEVRDTGIGMDAETQRRIFEPFFTTKPKGKGTGLGLASVYGIVKQSGGFIFVDSILECGTTFRMYLPMVAEALAEQKSAKTPHPSLAGTETVLLAEDESAVRAVARTFLQGIGYNVLEAGNGAEALGIARNHPGKVDLLLTDLIMPGIGGSELAAQVSAIRPDIKVAFMSGYSDFKPLQSDPHTANRTFVQKPFTRDSLARAIRQALDRRD
jgi:PAS domain S-box-containing protein